MVPNKRALNFRWPIAINDRVSNAFAYVLVDTMECLKSRRGRFCRFFNTWEFLRSMRGHFTSFVFSDKLYALSKFLLFLFLKLIKLQFVWLIVSSKGCWPQLYHLSLSTNSTVTILICQITPQGMFLLRYFSRYEERGGFSPHMSLLQFSDWFEYSLASYNITSYQGRFMKASLN